ncbi:arginine deiminase [bacterium A37T11]|nr:arginine deiminase [bacterium A37T11]
MPENMTINVSSEIATLRRVLVHSPDSGLGKVIPSKAQDWLFEDIVHLDSIRRLEYDFYTKLLLYFLDPDKIKGKLAEVDATAAGRSFYKPGDAAFYASDKVVELQWLLAHILEDEVIKSQLVASVCAIETCTFATQQELMVHKPIELAKVFFSGTTRDHRMLFPPVPNFIFTRDIGIVINQFILLNKPAKLARKREALLVKYIFRYHPLFADYRDNIIELTDTPHHFLLPKSDQHKVTLEGGDVMVISPDHLLLGISERTSWEAAHQVVHTLFDKKVVRKITLINIPAKRDYMHIDTIFTQVKKNVWIMLGDFSNDTLNGLQEDVISTAFNRGQKKEEQLKIVQFNRDQPDVPAYFASLEDLLRDVSVHDLGADPGDVRIILSANGEFPYDAREQWTDSCNLLALKEGVVLGYDRNDRTTEAFREAGFAIVRATDLIEQMENGEANAETISDTLILMPSAELSRARGGFHCMSMPLLRN